MPTTRCFPLLTNRSSECADVSQTGPGERVIRRGGVGVPPHRDPTDRDALRRPWTCRIKAPSLVISTTPVTSRLLFATSSRLVITAPELLPTVLAISTVPLYAKPWYSSMVNYCL
jgi:hypothetical protein